MVETFTRIIKISARGREPMARARCGSFDDNIWLAWYFLNTIVTDETFSVIFLQSHQQLHTAPEVALTVRSMLLKRKFRRLPLFKIVDFA